MTTRSISLMTEDGASNNKSSAKLLGAPFKVCAPHDLQRSVLFAAGIAGARSENPELKEFIGRASKMAAAPHRSTKTSDLLQKSQVARANHRDGKRDALDWALSYGEQGVCPVVALTPPPPHHLHPMTPRTTYTP